MAARFDCNLDLGPDTIGTRDENGLFQTRRQPKHSAEATKFSNDAAGESGFGKFLYAGFRCIGGIDVHTGASIAKRVFTHAGNASSNATSRRMSRIRCSISGLVTVIKRSIENFSTAKEPITEP